MRWWGSTQREEDRGGKRGREKMSPLKIGISRKSERQVFFTLSFWKECDDNKVCDIAM